MVGTTVVPKLLQNFDAGFCGGYFARRIIVKEVFVARYYWPTIFRDIFNYHKRSETCETFANKCIVSGNLYHIPPLGSFDKYDIDLMDYLPVIKRKYYFIVIIVIIIDYLTKFAEVWALIISV